MHSPFLLVVLMGNVVADSFETYASNLKLILLFSIPFIIAFLIPELAPMPTYISAGGIFLRTASIFINLNAVSLAVIVIAVFFSLLFISFAFVAISLIVKARRTYVGISRRILEGIERYTGKVFVLLLAYIALLVFASIIGYYLGHEAAITAIVGFFGFIFIFYAPTAIVVGNKRIGRAIVDSTKLMFSAPQYFLIWLALIIAIISVLDGFFVWLLGGSATGIIASKYIMLVLNALFIVPYFVIFQAEAYMKKFPLLRH